MPYLSLYRKYRPRNFAEIVGQRHVTQTLVNAIKAGRIAHAYLFCGPRGTGKTSTARVLAMALNCEKGPTSEPDATCESCRRIIAGSALDVIEIDAASNRGIDEIRELRERVGLAAADARTKVYIIDEVHMLTGEAFNAFLKTLEEPPSHVVFVLATTEPHRVLPTILSRCQRFDFHRIGVRDIEAAIRSIGEKESVAIDDSAVAMLAHAADGSFRDSLTLLDQAIAYAEGPVTAEVVSEILGGIDIDLVMEFTDVLLRRDIGGALTLVDRVVGEGKDLRQLVDTLIGHYRNLLVLTVDRRGHEALALPEESTKRLAAQAKLLTTDEITATLDLLAELDRELRFTSQPRL
ncbi:MAG: DNA polymerase III subunit gamma/tau, partial [Armatimonadota bacterium]